MFEQQAMHASVCKYKTSFVIANMTAKDLSLYLDAADTLADGNSCSLFDLMPSGVAYCRMLYQDARPYNFVFLYTNPAFHSLSGLGVVKGKQATEIIPDVRESNPDLFIICGAVSAGEAVEEFELYFEQLERWFSVQLFSPKPEHFIAYFSVINQRKRFEQTLISNEKRYKGLLEDQTEVICRFKADDTIVYVNHAFCRFFGKSPESLLGQVWHPNVLPEDLPAIHEKLNSVSPDNPTVLIENRIVTANGVLRWMQFVNRAFFDDQGVLQEMQAVGRDITEQKQAEDALKKSRRDLNHAQSVAHIGSWRLDVHNHVLEWSDETFRIFGIHEGTPLTYHSFLDTVHPSDRSLVDTAWKQALTGEPFDMEYRIRVGHKIKWLRGQAELEYDENGTVLSGFGTVKDITEVKNTHEVLQQERAFLKQVIDAVPSVIFVKDSEGRFLLANLALAESYGASPEDIIGKTEHDFNTNAEEVMRFHENDLMVINSRLPKHFPDEKVTHADGSVHWYSVVKIPLFDDNMRKKVLVVATDITENKCAREALREVNQQKDRFLAMLAHELRNPLAPIRNALQLLNRQPAKEPAMTTALHVIDRQVTHLGRLLDDLLDVARIMQDKVVLKVERLDVNNVVNNAIETSRTLIESREQMLDVILAEAPQWVDGDCVRLEQVVANLLNNAAKYTHERG